MKPNVGMMYPAVAQIKSYAKGSAVVYEKGMFVSEARGATLTWERADGHFYGNDAELDSDVAILGYTIDFEPTGITDEARAVMLGEVKGTDNEYAITGANAPDVGFGYIRVMREEDATSGKVKTSYEGWWFKKLKFGVQSEEAHTKERELEWRTPTIHGTGAGVFESQDAEDPTFAVHESFANLAGALSWLKGKAEITG